MERKHDVTKMIYIGTTYRPTVEAHNIEHERQVNGLLGLLPENVSIKGTSSEPRGNKVHLKRYQNWHGQHGGPAILNTKAHSAGDE